jgi:P-type E1-E2 ATPase
MILQAIPGLGTLRLEHLVLDFNGTLAADGRVLPGVAPRLALLSRRLELHVLTADTFGTARAALGRVRCSLVVMPARRQDRAKAAYVRRLGAARTACVGNGRNDRLMLKAAALGIVVLGAEGAAAAALAAGDLVVPAIRDALDALLKPLRLVASLRA